MRIALIGYGRMGHEIEKIALERGHEFGLIIDVDNADQLTVENLQNIDVVIEFTIPESAVENYKICFEAGIPVVSGSTGWLDQWDEVIQLCKAKNGTFFYASNFSLGVNLFFELNKNLAKVMNSFEQYKVEITEVHHTKKLDSPSGTAITLANDIINAYENLNGWENQAVQDNEKLGIISVREGDVPGIHTIKYESDVDFIQITHSSKNRKGLAFGAVIAAEYSVGKKGILSMMDLLKSEA